MVTTGTTVTTGNTVIAVPQVIAGTNPTTLAFHGAFAVLQDLGGFKFGTEERRDDHGDHRNRVDQRLPAVTGGVRAVAQTPSPGWGLLIRVGV